MEENTIRSRCAGISHSVMPWAVCVAIVCVFHTGRLVRPTFLGDDVIRCIDARVLPLREQLFRPFSEHIAPGFELATAALIRPLGDRIDLLPAALTGFAFISWLVMLAAVSWWARRITGHIEPENDSSCAYLNKYGSNSMLAASHDTEAVIPAV